MGISVASGAITTMGAGIMLFMCDIAFFQQYGSFIFLCILISLLAALTNLPPLILLLGPEDGRGQIAPLYWLAGRLSCAGAAEAPAGGAPPADNNDNARAPPEVPAEGAPPEVPESQRSKMSI